MVGAVLLFDLLMFLLQFYLFNLNMTSEALCQLLRLTGCCLMGLAFAWLDRARPVNWRTSLVLGGAALLLGLYALLMPVPLLWRLYDRVAWIGTSLDTMMAAGRPANPVFFFLGWTLADQCAFSSHMLLLSLFQLGRILFSRKAAPRPQAAQPI